MATRAEMDFFSNPYYGALMSKIQEQMRKETESLKATGRGESELSFQHQTGVVDGIERNLTLIENERKRVQDASADDA